MTTQAILTGSYNFWVAPLESYPACLSKADGSVDAMLACTTADSFVCSFVLMLFFGVFTFAASRWTGNDSWVDRSWSIVPFIHAWIVALLPNVYNKPIKELREAAMDDGAPSVPWTATMQYAAIITLWGFRLTFNYWRKDGYNSGVEDYRWEYVRQNKIFKIPVAGTVFFWIFHFTILSMFQELILWMIVMPLYALPVDAKPTWVDHFLSVIFLLLLLWETVADQQQWNFQNEKRELHGHKRRADRKADYERGFPSKGLFSRSRKPNVWAEIHLWVVIFGTSVFYKNGFNASALGFILLASLLIPAGFLTESISASKYPQYKVYRKHVPMFVPKMRNPRPALEKAFEDFLAKQAEKKAPKKSQ